MMGDDTEAIVRADGTEFRFPKGGAAFMGGGPAGVGKSEQGIHLTLGLIASDPYTPAQARMFAKWLLEMAERVERGQ